MKTHYYLSWFDNVFPEKLVKLLHEDIVDRKSLVMICTTPSDYNDSDEQFNFVKNQWLDPANILFDEYNMIDYRIQKEDAHKLLKNASTIFLCGGDTVSQNDFLREYELSNLIKNSNTIKIGASAGAINMSAKWLCSKNTGYEVETSVIYDGIDLDGFYFCSKQHLDIENIELLEELLPLSEEIDIYVTVNEGAIRVKDGKVDIVGEVYLISNSKIQKIDELL